MKQSTPDWLLAGILAAAGFLVSFVFIGMALPVSLVISGLCLAAGAQFFRQKPRLPEVPGAVGPAELEAALSEGSRKLETIRAIAKRLGAETKGKQAEATWFDAGVAGGSAPDQKTRSVPAKIDALCKTVSEILAEIRRDPDDLKRARQFLSYYLDSTITILEKYEKLTANPVRDDKIKTSIARVEAMLDTIDKAFEKQLANLLSNDVMDLDAELALLESTINMEGLGD